MNKNQILIQWGSLHFQWPMKSLHFPHKNDEKIKKKQNT
jgi:hypothetical protein